MPAMIGPPDKKAGGNSSHRLVKKASRGLGREAQFRLHSNMRLTGAAELVLKTKKIKA